MSTERPVHIPMTVPLHDDERTKTIHLHACLYMPVGILEEGCLHYIPKYQLVLSRLHMILDTIFRAYTLLKMGCYSSTAMCQYWDNC